MESIIKKCLQIWEQTQRTCEWPQGCRGRVRFGAGHFGAGHFGAGTIRRRNYFFRFVVLQLRCFGLQLASLAVGLRTLVSTGSRSTAFQNCLPHCVFLAGKIPAGKKPAGKRPSGEKTAGKKPRGKNRRGKDLAPSRESFLYLLSKLVERRLLCGCLLVYIVSIKTVDFNYNVR